MAETVLAIVGHLDDESFWMGGELARRAREGARVKVVAAADGLRGRSLRRLSQFRDACASLGVVGDLQDWFFDQESDRQLQVSLNDRAAAAVQVYHPSVVLTHYHGDLNHDHRRVSVAALVATRDVCPVWMCEPEYPQRCIGAPFSSLVSQVNVLSGDVLEAKWRACQCYPEELHAKPKTRNLDRFRSEAFVIVE